MAGPAAHPEADPRPLSFTQQRLWFVDRLTPGSAAYNMPAAYRLVGPLDAALLERSLREVVRRHEVLRTTYATAGGRLVQVIHPDVTLTLPVVDLTGLPEADREAEAQRLVVEDSSQTIDLEHGPILRAALYRLGPERHILLINIHHIAYDGWAMGVLYKEVATLYGAFSRGESSPLADLPIQYADYAARQREEMQGDVLDEHLAYWKEQLAGLSDALELSTDRPRPPEQRLRGSRLAVPLPAPLVEGLRALGRREEVTLYMTLLAAFQALMGRYSGQGDVAVGTPIAGRTRRETHGLIGCFLNMIVLRSDLADDPTFRDLLRRVRAMAMGAYAHQALPFERLVEELQPRRGTGRSPLFQVMFDLYKAPNWAPGLPGVEVTCLDMIDNGTAKYDLTLTMTESATGLVCDLEYDTDLFDRATASRLLEHYQALLESAVAEPGTRVSELSILTEAERHQVLVAWNDTGRDRAGERCVHEMFREQAARTPEAVAVVHQGRSLSYAELDARSDRLARRLRALGVGPESLVGLFVERSHEMVVGLLGILKAGGAYVPLDPELPPARLAMMLDDARVAVIATQTSLRDALPAHEAHVLCLDAEDTETSNGEALGGGASMENLAYVIYTSGSTGKPKGVQITHGALVNFLIAMRRLFGMTGRDTLMAVTTLSFDIAGLEMYLPLIQGARIDLVDRAEALDGAKLIRRLNGSGVTFLQATPATWRLLLDSGWRGTPGLTMLCGGEALPRDLADRLLDNKGAALWNVYGPTETTIWSSALHVKAGGEPITIGRPIDNTQLYVLDAHLRPVPIGVVGELYIGGDGLARGYLNRPDLTAERFINDPFRAEPGARLYKTGDRARFLADGNVDFLGRADDQVKIRGFRIEPGEVEVALSRHPAVRQAAVVVRDDSRGDKFLAAYVAPHPGQSPGARDLRDYLKERLPAYMVPASFTLLDALPLTFSGKVDRRALPDPRQAQPSAEEPPADDAGLPGTPVEQAIAGVFREILGIEHIYLHDSFIDLGGHSLQSVEAIAKLEERLGLRVTPRELLLQTVGQLALTCERSRSLAASPAGPSSGFVHRVLRAIKSAVFPGAAPGDVPLQPSQRS